MTDTTPAVGGFDPEMLPAPEMIRSAEQLIRAEHRIMDEDWQFWGNLADGLNFASHIPELSETTARNWREFSRARHMAIGIIRMSRAAQAGEPGGR